MLRVFIILLLFLIMVGTVGCTPDPDVSEPTILVIEYEECLLPGNTHYFKDMTVEYHDEFIRYISARGFVRDYPRGNEQPICRNPK